MKMKYIFFSLLISTFCLSQSINNLDEKNGFKSYKLGTPKIEIEKKFSLKKYDNEENTYLVVDSPDRKVFDYDVLGTFLTFDKNQKLGMIKILAESNTGRGEIGALEPNFRALFGKETETGELEKKGDVYQIWRGKKVNLDVNYLYRGTEKGWITLIQVYTKSFMYESFDNGF